MSADNWALTQAILGKLISKPPLKDNLLQRPPFRFIHDIVTSVMSATGYPVGLFQGDQLDSIKMNATRESKTSWLVRFKRLVDLAAGYTIDCDVADILAGRECNKVNILLQEFGKQATSASAIDLPALLSAVDSSISPGQTLFILKSETPSGPSNTSSTSSPASVSTRTLSASTLTQRPPTQRSSRPSSTSTSTPSPSSLASSLSPPTPSTLPSHPLASLPMNSAGLPIVSAPLSIPSPDTFDQNDYIACTQAMVGALISRPQMTQKLLSRPPFRFIQDIVAAIADKTGHTKGLYSESESNAENYKPGGTGNKQSYLSKLINYVATGLAEPSLVSTVSPKSIAAGVDPHLTNLLLQRFALLSASGVSGEHVLELLGGTSAPDIYKRIGGVRPQTTALLSSSDDSGPQLERKEFPSKNEAPPIPSPSSPRRIPDPSMSQPDSTATSTTTTTTTTNINNTSTSPPPSSPSSSSSTSTPSPSVSFAPSTNFGLPTSQTLGGTGLSRVATARRAPPKSSTALSTQPKPIKPMVGLIKESTPIEEEDEDVADSRNPTVSRGDGNEGNEGLAVSYNDAGQLVRNIQRTLGDNKQEGALKLGRVQTGRKANALYNSRQLDDLRMSVQKLCSAVNPIGKIAEFAQTDVDEMDRELRQWRKTAEQAREQLALERSATETSLASLAKLIEEAKQERDLEHLNVLQLKAAVLANETEIESLLKDITSGSI